MRFFKPVALTAALAMTAALATAGTAEAGSKHRDRAIAAGAIGVVAGMIIGGALSQPGYAAPVYVDPDPVYVAPEPYYEPAYRPAPRPYYRERVTVEERTYYRSPRHNRYHSQIYYNQAPSYDAGYDYRPQPWSDEWYAYCASKYRSFDPDSGTFQPNRGPRQLCR